MVWKMIERRKNGSNAKKYFGRYGFDVSMLVYAH